MPLARQEPQGEPGDCAGAHTPTCREGSGPGPTGTGTRGRAPSRLGAVPVQGPGAAALRLGVVWFLSEPKSPGLGGPALPAACSKFKGSTGWPPRSSKVPDCPSHQLNCALNPSSSRILLWIRAKGSGP